MFEIIIRLEYTLKKKTQDFKPKQPHQKPNTAHVGNHFSRWISNQPSMAPVWFLSIGGASHRRKTYAPLIG